MDSGLYSDRHSIFQRAARDHDTLEEQLAGQRHPTQFGRALKELGIQSILAQSPQAKGRVERLWGTLQDRLVSELRMAGASTVDEANEVLWAFLPEFNERFSVSARQSGSAYRHLPEDTQLESILCFKYNHTVANDNTISFQGRTLQLLPDLQRLTYARARVEVQQRIDGSIVACYRGKTIAVTDAPAHPVTLRAHKVHRRTTIPLESEHEPTPLPSHFEKAARPSQNGSRPRPPDAKRKPNKPAPNHPWRRPL